MLKEIKQFFYNELYILKIALDESIIYYYPIFKVKNI